MNKHECKYRRDTLGSEEPCGDRCHILVAPEYEVRHKRLAAYRHIGEHRVEKVASSEWYRPRNRCHHDAGGHAEHQSCLRNRTDCLVLVIERFRPSYKLGARQIKAEVHECLNEGHERDDVCVYRIALRFENAREVRERDEREDVLRELEAVLPECVLVKFIVFHFVLNTCRNNLLDLAASFFGGATSQGHTSSF